MLLPLLPSHAYPGDTLRVFAGVLLRTAIHSNLWCSVPYKYTHS